MCCQKTHEFRQAPTLRANLLLSLYASSLITPRNKPYVPSKKRLCLQGVRHHENRGILVYSNCLISISKSVSDGATNKSLLNIESHSKSHHILSFNSSSAAWSHFISKAPAKRSQHFNVTYRNIVGCNMLRAFGHPVATRCDVLRHVGCCWFKFENVQIFHAAFVDVA